ncbi:MAG TPA: PIN domain-containing protein [Afifellaceae bacterium]|nr:PIN domain-containing protein [Afifellaceae bacterium]
MSRVFLDTNVLVYSRDRRIPEKRAKARRWLAYLVDQNRAVVNLQVVNELTDVLLRRVRTMPDTEIRAISESPLAFGDTPVEREEMALAWSIRERFGFRWWDCLIIVAAQLLDCSYLLTEDLQHGQSVGTLTVIDPFTVDPEALFSPS